MPKPNAILVSAKTKNKLLAAGLDPKFVRYAINNKFYWIKLSETDAAIFLSLRRPHETTEETICRVLSAPQEQFADFVEKLNNQAS
jgi:hypothetical protein